MSLKAVFSRRLLFVSPLASTSASSAVASSSSSSSVSSSSSLLSLSAAAARSFSTTPCRRDDDDESEKPARPPRSTPPRFLPRFSTDETTHHLRAFKSVGQDIKSMLPNPIIGVPTRRVIPPPRAPIDSPRRFLTAVGRGLNGKFKEEITWKDLFTWTNKEWNHKIGLSVKDRKYLAWTIEKYRQGYDPRMIRTRPVRPKRYRGHGPQVQNGVRMKWSKKLDLGTARRPWGASAIVRVKKED